MPAFSVAAAQIALDGLARAVVQRQGLLCLIPKVELQDQGPRITGPTSWTLGL